MLSKTQSGTTSKHRKPLRERNQPFFTSILSTPNHMNAAKEVKTAQESERKRTERGKANGSRVQGCTRSRQVSGGQKTRAEEAEREGKSKKSLFTRRGGQPSVEKKKEGLS